MTTERMTDEARAKIEGFVEAGHVLSEDQASALLEEADRARASEDTLTTALQAKDAEIARLHADNAALLARLTLLVDGFPAALGAARSPNVVASVRVTGEALGILQELVAAHHPGAALLEEVRQLRAELERLKPSGPVAEDEERVPLTDAQEHDETIREFILAQEEPSDFALAALSRLASQAQSAQVLAEALERAESRHVFGCRATLLTQNKVCTCGADAALRLAGVGGLGGYAPNPPGILESSPNDSMPSNASPAQQQEEMDPDEMCDECGGMGGRHGHLPVYGDELPRMCSQANRHPCSTTCTHDDALTPGHPERVKERSEAVWRIVAPDAKCYAHKHINCPCAWDPPQTCHYPTPDGEPTEAAWKEAHELQKAYDRGAEAMRAACWEAVVERLVLHRLQRLRGDFKRAIAEATP